MLKRLVFVWILIAVVFVPSSFAQDIDSTDTEYEEENDNGWWNKWEDQEWFQWQFHGRPFIELNYGIGNVNRKDFYFDFAKNGLGEIKLGYVRNNSEFDDEGVSKYHDKYFFISRLDYNYISSKPKTNEMRFDMWRFGFAVRDGYGYNLPAVSIVPYHAHGFVWSRLNMEDFPADVYRNTDPAEAVVQGNLDTEFLNRINGTFRFGTNIESGLNINIAQTLGVNVGYESTVVFPRHMFWKHLGSMIIEYGGLGLLDNFIHEVADASPFAAPFINAILKGAYSYAFFTLQKDKMNWPFETETPLTTETFKFGIQFTF